MAKGYDFEVHKHRVETAFADYEQELQQFQIWLEEWRERNRAKPVGGFRCVERRREAE